MSAVITTLRQCILTQSRLVLSMGVGKGWGSEKPDICSLPWIFERKRNLQETEKETHKMLYSSYLKIYVSIRSSSLLQAASKNILKR